MVNEITIWVYDDEGTSELSVKSVLATVQKKLKTAGIITIQTISSADILNHKLASKSPGKGVLIMPGGADLPYCQKLNGLGNDIIRQFISKGNIYIGICAGGYYGAREIEFSGAGYEINGARELAFFTGTAIGSIKEFTNGQYYDEKVGSKAIVTLDYANGQQDEVYYHGGAYFLADADAEFEALATYSNGHNAVVSGNIGEGKYLLSGVHFELCPIMYERYVVAQADDTGIEKESNLLLAISNEHYGEFIYKEIDKMIAGVFEKN
ncbi:BPL-N domain-containing protein [Psychrobacter jeotgali]|uniref:BPL-N domain-containing protein n=1 Tax=Psychrobacter jeotgali TaxID=179010 RepID=UPI0019198F32|nr:BPL-N domain-containing protein [Psychrobacter jeotgali]